ncbi:MAG: TatD family deoxyribonuclease [Chlorobi bacterium]|nr:TatD family deoxyribonuclease [Chlorobiota bacterium]
MKYFDIHTHNAAIEEDVIKVVNIFPEEKLPKPVPDLLFSSGIHPWHIDEQKTEKHLKTVAELSETGKIAAIGECGIDKLKGTEYKQQEDVFRQHIGISEKYHLPLIIHCVKAYNEILTLRKSAKAKQPWILHGFSSSKEMMQLMTAEGLYISLGTGLLKENSKSIQLIKEIPLNRLFLETDVSNTGIRDIYKRAAGLTDTSVENLKEIIFQNFKTVF